MTILEKIKSIEKIRTHFERKSKKTTLAENVFYLLICFTISLASYLILFKNLNLKFYNPPTTTISWFTINNYPRQQEYFYFLTGFLFLTIFTIILWGVFLWLKKFK